MHDTHLLPELNSHDILFMEDLLCGHLSKILDFKEHSLYFPTEHFQIEPKIISRERKLLLPIIWNDNVLAILILSSIKLRQTRRVLSLLPSVVQLCVEILIREKASRTDVVTGFLREEYFYANLEREVDLIRNCLDQHNISVKSNAINSCNLGFIVVRIQNIAVISKYDGFVFRDLFLRRLAIAYKALLLKSVYLVRLGESEFGIAFGTHGRVHCENMAKEIISRMQMISLTGPQTGQEVRPVLCAGHAIYPQDMQDSEFILSNFEQVRLFVNRARLACDIADKDIRQNNIIPFSGILREGGIITEILPSNRQKTTLGRRVKAREGMRFSVLNAESGLKKGEIVLLRVEDDESIAETVFLEDPSYNFSLGDRLYYTKDAFVAPNRAGVFGLGEFLNIFQEKCKDESNFVIAIMRVNDSNNLEKSKQHWQKNFPLAHLGYYGENSLIFFHPSISGKKILPKYEKLAKKLWDIGIECAIGLASYPFLNFGREEMEDCAIKALEYAMLLPKPHVGLCDSLTLNISADKQYSYGDVFGAIEGYKAAILADEKNVMAWISLGVCLASIDKNEEARRYFIKALSFKPSSEKCAQICYNLGTINQNLDKIRSAIHFYKKCLDYDSKHFFAYVRLGQLYEKSGRKTKARICYENALKVSGNVANHESLARRLLANIAVRQKRNIEARELLHEALLKNPNDAKSLLLLAEIYLENNEDPSVAEALSRKSLKIQESSSAWKILGKALCALGRKEEASWAENKALSKDGAIII